MQYTVEKKKYPAMKAHKQKNSNIVENISRAALYEEKTSCLFAWAKNNSCMDEIFQPLPPSYQKSRGPPLMRDQPTLKTFFF